MVFDWDRSQFEWNVEHATLSGYCQEDVVGDQVVDLRAVSILQHNIAHLGDAGKMRLLHS